MSQRRRTRLARYGTLIVLVLAAWYFWSSLHRQSGAALQPKRTVTALPIAPLTPQPNQRGRAPVATPRLSPSEVKLKNAFTALVNAPHYICYDETISSSEIPVRFMTKSFHFRDNNGRDLLRGDVVGIDAKTGKVLPTYSYTEIANAAGDWYIQYGQKHKVAALIDSDLYKPTVVMGFEALKSAARIGNDSYGNMVEDVTEFNGRPVTRITTHSDKIPGARTEYYIDQVTGQILGFSGFLRGTTTRCTFDTRTNVDSSEFKPPSGYRYVTQTSPDYPSPE